VTPTAPVWFRWFGVAGIELHFGPEVLLVDPFLTRPALRRLFFGRSPPNRALLQQHIGRADVVLVTHAHWDHLLDVAPIAESSGALVVGSPNTCAIVAAHGIPASQTRMVEVGEHLVLGAFQVDVLPAEHGRTALDWLINGRLPPDLRPPLRLRDYRMDRCFSYRIEVGGLSLLDSPGPPVPADVLAVGTNVDGAKLEALIQQVHPRLVIPMHWDNLFRPLRDGLRPVVGPPVMRVPSLRKLHPREFERAVAREAPEIRVLVPTALTRYDLDLVLRRHCVL
jgi:L-ascorbate metabolism protein UlaG (beta-lactamase superfamily)